MKHLSFIFFALLMLIPASVLAQTEKKLVSVRAEMFDRSQSLSGNGGIVIVSSMDNLVIHVASGNQVVSDVQPTKQKGNKYEYVVPINISNIAECKVQVSPRGNTSNKVEITSKQLVADKLLGYTVERLKKTINVSYPAVDPTDKHLSKTEALIEIQSVFSALDINLPETTGFSVTHKQHPNDPETTIYDIIVPVAKIKELKTNYSADSLALSKLNDDDYNNYSDADWAKLDALEKKIDDDEAALNECSSIVVNVPSVSENFTISDLLRMEARDKVIVAVLRFDSEGGSSADESYNQAMLQAQAAVEMRRYGDAKIMYELAASTEGVDARKIIVAQSNISQMETLAQLADMLNSCAVRWRDIKKNGEKVPQHVVEDILQTGINVSKNMYFKTNDEFYQSAQQRFTKSLNELPVIIEGKVRIRNYDNGVMSISDLHNCEIFATSNADKTDNFVGNMNNDGTFSLQLNRGQYDTLVFKPLSGSPLQKERRKKLINRGLKSETMTIDFKPR